MTKAINDAGSSVQVFLKVHSSNCASLALLLNVSLWPSCLLPLFSSWWWDHSERPPVHFPGAGDDGVGAHLAGPWLFSDLHKQKRQVRRPWVLLFRSEHFSSVCVGGGMCVCVCVGGCVCKGRWWGGVLVFFFPPLASLRRGLEFSASQL